jgi:hypothetical protein
VSKFGDLAAWAVVLDGAGKRLLSPTPSDVAYIVERLFWMVKT